MRLIPSGLRPLVALAFGALAAVLPARAQACFDGLSATGEGVRIIQVQEAQWDPATARRMASWVTRLEALVPARTTIEITNGSVSCEGDGCANPAWIDLPSGDMVQAFAATADLVGADAASIARAGRLTSSVFTVQVYAGSRKGALAMRERIHALDVAALGDLAGFYSEGGFPAVHPVAHVLHDPSEGTDTHRVVVGVHRRVGEAREIVPILRAAGFPGFARPLPEGIAVDEPVQSDAG